MATTGVDDAIIRPIAMHGDCVGRTAVMVSTSDDLFLLCDILGIKRDSYRQLFTSRLYCKTNRNDFCIVGPVLGAAYAALVSEILVASGVERIFFYGWCGSVSSEIHTGSIFLPTRAVAEEGVAQSYVCPDEACVASRLPVVDASWRLKHAAASVLSNMDVDSHEGTAWTTGAIFRETRSKVRFFQQQKVSVVDMESSAVFAVADFRGAEAAAILVVSDELFDLTWRPGFGDRRFMDARSKASEALAELCTTATI